MAVGVLDVDDVEGAGVALARHDGAHPAGISSAGNHAQVTGVELDDVLHLPAGNVHLDRVVDLEQKFSISPHPRKKT